MAEENGFKYHDILNEIKIISDGVCVTIKSALSRNSILLSGESDDINKAQELVNTIEKLIIKM